MRPPPTPRCNAKFVRQAIIENKRIDHRLRDEHRDLEIIFGKDYGSAIVSLGRTVVMSSVSSEIVQPKATRPNEGQLQISVDLSPMASPYFENFGRPSDLQIEVLRILERSIRDSRCIDLESLCLVAGEKVWSVHMDIIVLNNEGNIVQAASIAAIASLAHYKHPDVSVSADSVVTVHSFEERHPIGLTVLHYPFCVEYAFFENGQFVVTDPVELEEINCDGKLVMSANSYGEITALHVSGKAQVNKERILACAASTVEKVKQLTMCVKTTLEEDSRLRSKGESIGFAAILRDGTEKLLTGDKKRQLREPFSEMDMNGEQSSQKEEEENSATQTFSYGRGFAGIGEGGPSTWEFLDKDMQTFESDDEEEQNIADKTGKSQDQQHQRPTVITRAARNPDVIELSSDEASGSGDNNSGDKKKKKRSAAVDSSDEDEVMILETNEFGKR